MYLQPTPIIDQWVQIVLLEWLFDVYSLSFFPDKSRSGSCGWDLLGLVNEKKKISKQKNGKSKRIKRKK